ncbi:diguanylate cyclase (GGDEF) domain-containing protein [Devosia enhydra]|uniref:diguanylate cyclase n=1 Tax=Devosia enhydra TaxID=665118 RepID=A0A1K2HW16_9HYPH|nr:diguanylate cyclase [Devosia enhydra]SFZ83103.1 diguanylate cyclase (GGDEF) domain-containing protein [Devosia enhydra]
MMFKRSLRQIVVIGFVLALVAGNSALLFVALDRMIQASSWVKHSLGVQKDLASLHVLLVSAETAERGYLLTSDTTQLAPYHQAIYGFSERIDRLRAAFNDNPVQAERFSEVARLSRERLARLASVIQLHSDGDPRAAIDQVRQNDGSAIMTRVRAMIAEIEAEEAILLEERQRQNLWAQLGLYASAIVFIFGSLALITYVYMSLRMQLRERTAAAASSATYAETLDESLKALEHERNEIAQINDGSNFLQSCNSMAEVAALSAEFLKGLFPGYAGSVSVYAASRNQLLRLSTWGGSNDAEVFSPDACWGLRRGQPHARHHDKAGTPTCSHLGCGSDCDTICVPLIAHGETLGLLTLARLDPVEAALNDIELAKGLPDRRRVEMVARQLGLTLANLRLRETLAEQSIRDPLTNSFNRRYLEVIAGKEIAQAARFERSLAFVMLDVDHFKRFNDLHGHAAGDAALIAVAGSLQDNIREGDWLFRLGGEEFVLVLREVTRQDALEKVEQLRAGIADLTLSYAGGTLPRITVSMGVALFPDNGAELDELLVVADRALYASKSSGRNRVTLASANEETPVAIAADRAA